LTAVGTGQFDAIQSLVNIRDVGEIERAVAAFARSTRSTVREKTDRLRAQRLAKEAEEKGRRYFRWPYGGYKGQHRKTEPIRSHRHEGQTRDFGGLVGRPRAWWLS
jgi:hypothetical protein